MAQSYVVSRGRKQAQLADDEFAEELNRAGAKAVVPVRTGSVVEMSTRAARRLEDSGYRVLPVGDVDVLEVGGHRIDLAEGAPEVPSPLDVPRNRIGDWRHHLVQLVGPAQPEWLDALRDRGVEVVEPLPPLGLFVIGRPDRIETLSALPFVRWAGAFKPAYRITPRLAKMSGTIRYVNIGFMADGDMKELAEAIEVSRGSIEQVEKPEGASGPYITIVATLAARSIAKIARLPDVRWLDFQPESILYDERGCQIGYGDLDGIAPPNTGPNTGYGANLADLGLTGNGVTIAICDSGIDTHDNANMQADLAGRMTFFVDQSSGNFPVDRNGHGTHVAGIAAGNGATGNADPGGFVLGQGVAPAASFGSINGIGTGVGVNLTNWVQTAATNDSDVMNNSWGTAFNGVALINQGYTALCRQLDQLVRDPNTATATLEAMTIVWAAGNSGPNLSTLGEPNEAKNIIVVGNSLNFRPGEGDLDDIRGLRASSSRGPAVDTRILPNVIAPGTDIISARPGPTVDGDTTVPGIQQPRDPYTDTGGTTHDEHFRTSGTSMAAPHVAGYCALLIEWWRARTGGKTPSAALLKALLINGAVDVVGGPSRRGTTTIANIPNNDQGWGRVSLENMLLQAPATDRGPKLFLDQRHAFTATGQEYTIRVAAADPDRPLRITLVWTDAPGAINANPALVNNLNLEVIELASGDEYRGNQFTNGFSTPGGGSDNRNNVECVYLQNPNGTYEVTVVAANITASAHPDFAAAWQDFALVIDNAEVPAAAPVAVVPVIDRSGSMSFYGYVDITRTSSKQFVDLMSVDDEVGIVSFGDTGNVEYPTGSSPAMQTITGPATRTEANARVDAIHFSGCTFMGDGIVKARDLLAGASSPNRAMVLLSDGYDNKGCDSTNPAKLSASQAAATLPADLPIYACAMGPTSDQGLLEQLADDTNGRYYYMPSIDDLFEIYNYIRGQVTGEGVIVNESGTASLSRKTAVVDGCARLVTFSVAWADPKLRYVARDPRKSDEISVRLREPGGRLLPANASEVHRIEGAGYLILKVHEPAAGAWTVEVRTSRASHTRYTLGGFVESGIHLDLRTIPTRVVTGSPFRVIARAIDRNGVISGLRATATVTAPEFDVRAVLKRHDAELRRLRVPREAGKDLADPLSRLGGLRAMQIAKEGVDILPHRTTKLGLSERSPLFIDRHGLGAVSTEPASTERIEGSDPASGPRYVVSPPLSGVRAPAYEPPLYSPGVRLPPIGVRVPPIDPRLPPIDPRLPPIDPRLPPIGIPPRASGVFVGDYADTQVPGSYNVVVQVAGGSPACGTRFVRKGICSVLVKDRER